MVAVALPQGEQTFFLTKLDVNGQPYTVPNAGGFVYMYAPGSTVPQTTWQNASQTTANTDPIVLDSSGRCLLFGVGQYRQIVTDAQANTQWDQLVELGIDSTFLTSALTTAPVLVDGPNPNPPLSTPDQGTRALNAVLGSFVDARNGKFGALRQGGNDLTVIQAAINYAASIGGATVYLGPGPLTTDTLTQLIWPSNASGVILKGDGPNATVLTIAGNPSQDCFVLTAGNLVGCQILDLGFSTGTATNGALIHAANTRLLLIERVYMNNGFYNGIFIESGANQAFTTIRDCSIVTGVNNCVQVGGDTTGTARSTTIESCVFGTAQIGIVLRNANGVHITDTTCTALTNHGIATLPPPTVTAFDIQIDGTYCNGCTNSGFYLGDAGGNSYFTVLTNCWSGGNTIGIDIGVNPQANNISIAGCQIHSNRQQGILNNGANGVLVTGCLLAGNGTQTTNTYDAISIGGSCLQNVVNGNFIGQAYGIPPMHRYAVTLGAGCDYCVITNNVTGAGGTGSINNASTATHNVVTNNTGT